MSTTGDRQADWSLQERGGKGLFTKSKKAILDGRADIAVHSAKDMPTEDPAGLKISSFLKRGSEGCFDTSKIVETLKGLHLEVREEFGATRPFS